jgi:uncharacterized coiled-coil protein SlyX
MSSSYTNLDQALKDLVEAFAELEEEVEDKFSDDEDSYSHAMVETLETSIESALEEHDVTTASFANLLSNLTEALEQLDPSAFDDDETTMVVDDSGDEDIEDIDDDDDYEDIDDD